MKYLLLIVSITYASHCLSQDEFYNQFYNNPLALNPAMTGKMKSDYRASAHHRSQWSSIGNPFVTSMASYDMPILKKRRSLNHAGVGGYILQDKAGKSSMGIFRACASGAYHIGINDFMSLGAGIQLSFVQRSANFSDLKWDNQFNGVGHDPSVASGESFNGESKSFVDYSLGFFLEKKRNMEWGVGYAQYHYRQHQGFLDGKQDRLLLRHRIHGYAEDKIGGILGTADASVNLQGGALKIEAGIRANYRIGMDSRHTSRNTSSAVIGGIYYRWQDAIIPVLGYEFKRMITAFFSYDINVSGLRKATNGNGGWEISLIYNGHLTPQRRRLR